MIRVFCTKKIIEMLPKAPQPYTGEIPELDKWCVNLTTIQRRKAVIAICADTRYGFVLWGLRKTEFEKLPELISNGIRETFNYYGIRAEVADAYLSGLPVLCTGNNRKDTARLNRLTIDVSSMRFDSQLTDLLPIGLASIINDIPVDVTTKNAFFPLDRMLEKLKEKYGMNPICRPAFEITARMDLDVTEARRVVLVPASYTFEELHLSLQAAFGWKKYHMYEFNIGQERISCTDEWDDEETPKLASDTVLSDYLKEGDELVYYYDFGDSWEVSIRVTSLIPDFDKPGPECTECEGAAPPEDVGGVPGFVEFMEAYKDPDHPEHEEMLEWVGYLWRSEPDIRSINARMRR